MVEPPQTDEGWYVLHDFRTVDWDAWRETPQRERDRAVEEGVEYLRAHEALADAEEGASAVFSVVGHKADLLVMHLRPTLDDLSRAERRFEQTALAAFTEQPTSYVSVTEVSGYTTDAYFENREEMDEGLRRYMDSKIMPEIPDDQFVCFYPMSKRRGEEKNWYDLPFDERAEMMSSHGEKARKWGGKIKQIISASSGFDDWEWGVTLFGEDPIEFKNIVYELRFDEASSVYGKFGPFYVGRRFPPEDLDAYLAGETVPTSEQSESDRPHGESAHGEESPHGGDAPHGTDDEETEGIRGELADLDIYAGQPHGEDVYATVLYSEADPDDLFGEVEGLRANFDHYDTHVKTAVYEATDRDRLAVVSLWETASAAETAAGFLADLPEIVSRAGEESGFGTMGMFYTVEPEHREDFVEKFRTVGELLGDMEGHLETDLMANLEDENDMFIASQWRSKGDAMSFFRSDAFSDTVEWGRDILADRPRHVFLA